jgi:hypothetical protein
VGRVVFAGISAAKSFRLMSSSLSRLEPQPTVTVSWILRGAILHNGVAKKAEVAERAMHMLRAVVDKSYYAFCSSVRARRTLCLHLSKLHGTGV